MAEKISVEIALDGGDEVERQLADIGDAGKKTFGDLQSSADQIDFSSVSDQFQTVATAIDTAQTAVKAAAGFESIIQGVKNVEGAFETLGVAATKMAARMTRSLGLAGVALRALGPVGIGIGAVGGALLKFGNDAAESINQLNAEAAKLGIGFQQLDALSRGLQQAGISSEAASAGFEQLKSAGLNVAQALPQIIAQLQAMPDGVNRTNTAIALLGEKLGVEVVAALRTGSLTASQFNATMGTLTEEQRNNAALQEQSLNKLSLAWNDFKINVATPVAIPLFDLMKTGLDQINQGIATTKQEWAALQSLLTKITPKVGIDISLTGSLQPQLDAAGQKLDEIAQKGTQAAQQGTVAFTAWGEAIKTAGGQGAAAGQAAADRVVTAGQAAQQTGIMFTSFGTVAQQAGTQAAQSAQQGTSAWERFNASGDAALAKIREVVQAIAGITWDAISSLGVQAWNALTGAIQNAINKVLEFIGLKPSGPATGGGAPGKARGGMIGGRGTGTSDSNLAWLSRGEFVVRAAAVRKYGAGLFAALNAQRFAGGGLVGGGGTSTLTDAGGIDQLVQAITTNTEAVNSQSDVIIKLGDIITGMTQTVGGLIQTVEGLVQTVGGLTQQQGQLTKAFNDLMAWAARSAPGKAAGGLLGGRGTGTSDSNLAWLSRGEHIMPARAVAQPGVLAFLEALRRSGGNLSRVLDGMGRFALGGMVPRMPAFAAGGAGGGMSHVTIAFPGLPAIGGLRASSDVVDQLQRAAALAQVRSGGRKPSRYS